MPRRSEAPSFADFWRDLRADYNMARRTRFERSRKGVASLGRTGDYHYRNESDFLYMIELARDMADRNDPVVGQIVDRAVHNMIQGGITPDPQTGDEGLNTELSARYQEEAADPEICDLGGEHDLLEIQYLVARHTLVDGDILALPTRDGPLELVEAHRVRTPRNTRRNVVHGVLLNDYRRRLEYWITKDDVDPNRAVTRVADMKQYPVRDAEGRRQIYHVYHPKRVSRTRGVTALAPITSLAGYLDDTIFARLVQQQAVSCFILFRQRDAAAAGLGAVSQQGERTTETLADGSLRTIEGMAPGMQLTGIPGEKLMGFSPDVPNPEFFPFVRLILTLIGINLGLPLILVTMDASETNFSGWRGAVEQAKLGFRQNQNWLISRLLRPNYLRKVRRWGADDPSIAARVEGSLIFRHRWNRPAWPYIQPREEAMADLVRLRNCQISHRRWAQERGMDWDDLSTEIVEDHAALIEKAHLKAEDLNKRYSGLGLTWRDLAALPMPEGLKMQLSDVLPSIGSPEVN